MDWIDINDQPLPKDGKVLIVTIKFCDSGLTYIAEIVWRDLEYDGNHKWFYADRDVEVAPKLLPGVAAWMYYPEPYTPKNKVTQD